MTIQEDILLAPFTSIKTGGPARFFVHVESEGELRDALSFASERGLPHLILGGGSNVLVPDEGFDGLVIKMELRERRVEESDDRIHFILGAGEEWDKVVELSVVRGWYGLENLSGIPGSVGAAPVQNIGAYGSEVSDVLLWAEVYDIRNKRTRRLSNRECAFSYRDSVFKRPEGKDFVVLRVAFSLGTSGAPNLTYQDVADYFEGRQPSLVDVRNAILDIRSRKFPDGARYGTAGSFFKNPVLSREAHARLRRAYPDIPSYPAGGGSMKVSAAWILDRVCGARGLRRGNVGAFERQPLVLVNYGGASARDIEAFAEELAACVREHAGIELEWEVKKIISSG